MAYDIRSKCKSCGKRYNGQNHHCSKAHEAGVKGAQTRANNAEISLSYDPPKQPIGKRLSQGFILLGLNERE
jgi:hypothetical protein